MSIKGFKKAADGEEAPSSDIHFVSVAGDDVKIKLPAAYFVSICQTLRSLTTPAVYNAVLQDRWEALAPLERLKKVSQHLEDIAARPIADAGKGFIFVSVNQDAVADIANSMDVISTPHQHIRTTRTNAAILPDMDELTTISSQLNSEMLNSEIGFLGAYSTVYPSNDEEFPPPS